jgi:hypothetical protein
MFSRENRREEMSPMGKNLLRALKEMIRRGPPRDASPAAAELPRPAGYDLEEEAREAIRIVRSHTMLSYERLITLYQQAAHCERARVPGCFVECGTWKGGAVAIMALANLRHGDRRRPLHLFDSFEGIPEPDEGADGEKAAREVRSVGGAARGRLSPVEGFYERFADGVGTLEINRRLMEEIVRYDPAYLRYHKGWFQDTVPRDAAGVGPVAILRLDGDWYASTKVCLEHLYGNVVPGGFVVVDDYGHYPGCRKAVDEFLEREGIRPFLTHIDYTGRYWIKPGE